MSLQDIVAVSRICEAYRGSEYEQTNSYQIEHWNQPRNGLYCHNMDRKCHIMLHREYVCCALVECEARRKACSYANDIISLHLPCLNSELAFEPYVAGDLAQQKQQRASWMELSNILF